MRVVSSEGAAYVLQDLVTNLFSGNTPGHCGTSCIQGYGLCTGHSISDSWSLARNNSISDTKDGGLYFWDSASNIFWTWDSPTFIAEKFTKIVQARSLGGVMSWSLGEDTYNNQHLLAIQKGVRETTSHTPRQRPY